MDRKMHEVRGLLDRAWNMIHWWQESHDPNGLADAWVALGAARSLLSKVGKEEEMKLELAIEFVADGLEKPYPHQSLKLAAMYLITEYDRRRLPDWIEALANGNIHNWNDVVDEVRRLKKAEEL